MSGRWEVAGKSSKKPGVNASKKAAKKQKKETVPLAEETTSSPENFPVANPLTEHQNIFNLMRESDSDNEQENHVEKDNMITKPRLASAGRVKGKKKTSPVAQVKKAEREQLLDQLEEIDNSDLKELVAEVKKRFPTNPRIWLKDIQSYFNMKITVKEADPGFTMYEAGYPLNLLSDELAHFLYATFKEVPENVMIHFYLEVLDSFAKDIRNGVSGYHHRLLLQAISQSCPRTIHSNEVTTKLQAMLTDSVPRPKECVALMWCLYVTPRSKLETKLEVWFTWMLPILQTRKTERPVQDYIFKCLEDTVKEIVDTKENVEITPSDFFGYFDLVFAANNGLVTHIQELFVEMLPAVKRLAFLSSPETRLRSFFPSLLIRLQQSGSAQKKVVLSYLVNCLQSDAQCWLLWQQMFTKHLNSSVALLEQVHEDWPAVVKTVNKTALKQTLDYVVVTLSPANGKVKVKDNQRKALALSSDMLHALGSPLKGALKLALLVMMALTAAYVLHDIKEFGSFDASRTGRMYSSLLEHDTVKDVMKNVQECGRLVHKHGMAHVPLLMEYAYTIYNSVSSTLVLFVIFLQDNFNYLIDNKELVAEQIKAGAVDAVERSYSLITSVTTPENVEWLENTVKTHWELSVQYWDTGSEYVCAGAAVAWASAQSSYVSAEEHVRVGAAVAWASAQSLYISTQEYITDNFINEPVTIERLKAWILLAYTWLTGTVTLYYDIVVNSTLKMVE